MTAGIQKIWHPNPKIGFLAAARNEQTKINARVIELTKEMATSSDARDEQMVHEMAHFLAYEKKFSLEEKKTLEKLHRLEISPYSNDPERWNYYDRNKEIIDRYLRETKSSKEGHWYDPWYLEYKKLFWKLYNSDFRKYAYGKITEPLKYGFNEKGKGKYEIEIVKYKLISRDKKKK